jgi:tetratricopeptide (TPR) repeat protein
MSDPRESVSDARFREALALHRQSRFDEAATAYRRVLECNPRHAQALTFLGVIAFQSNQFERALGFANGALELDPHSAATHLIQGHCFARLNQFEAAVGSYDRAIALNPDFADAHRHRADILDQLGRHLAALSSYDKALELQPDTAEIHNNRANALRGLQRYEAAIVGYDRAIALAPHLPEPYFNRGLAQHELKLCDAALLSYDRAISINPRYAEAYYSRANVLKDMRRLNAALSSYDQAVELRSGYAEAYVNRGNVLGELERFDAALASYDSALSLTPGYADAHCNRGILLSGLQRDRDALHSLDRAIAIDPNHALAHFTRSLVYLVLGDLQNGWREFEWRWNNEHCVTSREKRNFRQPLWLGDEPIGGRTILVHCEQGLGDTIQFSRFVKLLAERGATVIFEVPESLYELLRGSLEGVALWVRRGEPLPPFECYCPLLSLPLAFETTLETIPSEIPYLRADPRRVQYWRERLGARTGLRVGVVWSGGVRPDLPELQPLNDRRNIPLRKLAALKLANIEFVSLQKGQPAEGELAELKASCWEGPELLDHTRELHDFGETAALIEQLDLVISVDTATVHLAGALGKPVWMLDRFDACWRWLRDRSDSPWYPSVRLYRQRQRGDWEGVVQRVRRDLEHLAARHIECLA